MPKTKRCAWVNNSNKLMVNYHDHEWCKPEYNDQKLFEMLTLEIFQSGLSWQTIINKRNNFKDAFNNFNYQKVAKFDQNNLERLMNNSGIIRNLSKIKATINNAQIIMKLREADKTFSEYMWHFTNNQIIDHQIRSKNEVPAQNKLSNVIAKDLKQHGFKFVGPVITYSFIQSIGIINDHEIDCEFHDR